MDRSFGFDGHAHALHLLEEPKRFAWDCRTEPVGQWVESFRSALAEVIALRPAPASTSYEVVCSVQLDGYRRDEIVFDSVPGLKACGFLLVPDGIESPVPSVLCLPGHGRGVDPIIGIAADGSQRPIGQPDEYANDFALRCVSEGYVVLALEHFSFGRRQSLAQKDWDYSCVMDTMALLMAGETMIGRRVFDARRAIDILSSHPLVDPARISTMGISGGGTVSLFTAAMDLRVFACVVSGYFCTFQESILAVPHCVDNFAPGLGQLTEMPDIAALIAPRRLFVESGTLDPIFPLPGFLKAVSAAQRIYQDLGHESRFGHEVFQGDHVFHGDEAFGFLKNQHHVTQRGDTQ